MNADDYLQESLDEAEKPLDLPAGRYKFTIVSATPRTSGNGDWIMNNFGARPVEAIDVDETELAEYGDLGQGLQNYTILWPANGSDNEVKRGKYNLRTFFVGILGLSDESTFSQCYADCIDAQFEADVTYKADKDDPTILRSRLIKASPAA